VKAARLRDRCQQPGCRREWVTWCPLCRKMLCQEHDELVPVRRHDCLSGPADALTINGAADEVG
jgi:hypothetical protein